MWRVVDAKGRKTSITTNQYRNAIEYKRIMARKYPEYEWIIVKVKEK